MTQLEPNRSRMRKVLGEKKVKTKKKGMTFRMDAISVVLPIETLSPDGIWMGRSDAKSTGVLRPGTSTAGSLEDDI